MDQQEDTTNTQSTTDSQNTNQSVASGPEAAHTEQGPQMNLSNDKVMALVAYCIFFVPLIMGIKSEFVRFHTNQATVLAIASIGALLFSFIPLVGMFSFLVHIGVFVLWIMGIVGAAKGETKPLPLIGDIRIV